MSQPDITQDCSCCGGTGQVYDDVKLGAWFRQVREDCDVTIRDMAKKIGYVPSHLTMLEKGQRHWTSAAIDAYVKYLGWDPRRKGVNHES